MFRPARLLLVLTQTSLLASPLTVFDQADLDGTGTAISETFTIYSGSSIPDGLDDKISSFRLEVGHMAVVAAFETGLGPGKPTSPIKKI